jgi:dihydrodipicolinate synthase/N-acetylneuraminate lyase
MLTRENFTGPWAGLPVPWTARNTFDEETYRGDVTRCCKAGMPGVYTGGTTGEFYAVEFDEFKAITRATVEECRRHGTPSMIGCTSTHTLGAARRAAYAAEVGADAIQVAVPFWMEVPAGEVVPFFKEVAAAAPGLALSVYETRRAKIALTLEQHLGVKESVPKYLMVKANEDTLGCTPEGCRALSSMVNVFVGENLFGSLGRCGAKGCCSSVVYWGPAFILGLWKAVERADWSAVDAGCARLEQLFAFLLQQWGARGFTDTAYDRLGGHGGGFLKTGLQGRGPYPMATAADLEIYRAWCLKNFPEMLVKTPRIGKVK